MQFLKDAKTINFNEKEHIYTLESQKFISVTSFIDTFANKFDPDGSILKRKAESLQITPDELQKQWDANRDEASEFGSKVHASIEYYLNTGKIRRNECKDIITNFKDSYRFDGEIFAETGLLDRELGICGTADLIQVLDNNVIQVHDFKTNKKPLTDFSYGKKMLHPIEHLNDSKLNKYFLQISLYLYLLSSKYGYEIGKENYIFWLNRKKEQFERIPVELKMNEVFDMIALWMYNHQTTNE